MTSNNQNHFIIVASPAQGQINPTLQLAKRLVRTGAQVTFVTSIFAHKRMSNTQTIDGLTYAPFSDGYEGGFNLFKYDVNHFMSVLQNRGSEALTKVITASANEGRPVTCIIYAIMLPWAADVAREHKIQSVLMWIQPATVFDIYYYYYNGYKDIISNLNNDPSSSVNLQGLPSLTSKDLPSFLLPTNIYTSALEGLEKHFLNLQKETTPVVLVNTFDSLELESIKAVDSKIKMVGIGPLIPSAFLDGQDPSDTSFGGDLFNVSNDHYMEWLNSKEEASVIYVSFGSIAVLDRQQSEEMAKGLIKSRRPFLWVIRENKDSKEEDIELLNWIKREGKEGKIVPWCSQIEVLSHPSVGCFITHCGWNSTLESLVCGVPVVGFPQWSDQGTNAKLVEDVWRTGVRMRVNEKIVEREEVSRCVEVVMGSDERGKEMRKNAKKWKELAREAAKEGGSSERNLRAFMEEICDVGGGKNDLDQPATRTGLLI